VQGTSVGQCGPRTIATHIAPTIRVLMGLSQDRADGAGRAIDLITELRP